MYKHILVATDGSKLSLKAVKTACSLADSVGARLTGLYVMPEYVPPVYGEAALYLPETSPRKFKEPWTRRRPTRSPSWSRPPTRPASRMRR